MAGNISDYLELKLLDHSLGGTAYTMPSNVRVALFTTATDDAGGGTEVTGGAYGRVPLGAIQSNGAGGRENAALIQFAVATASWGTITHVAIYDATTGGNMLWHGPAVASKAIATGDRYEIAIGDLDFTLD